MIKSKVLDRRKKLKKDKPDLILFFSKYLLCNLRFNYFFLSFLLKLMRLIFISNLLLNENKKDCI